MWGSCDKTHPACKVKEEAVKKKTTASRGCTVALKSMRMVNCTGERKARYSRPEPRKQEAVQTGTVLLVLNTCHERVEGIRVPPLCQNAALEKNGNQKTFNVLKGKESYLE